MIAQTHRFHGLNALRFAYSRGQTVRGQVLAIKYIFNNKRRLYRAAVVVSRKVHKSAVVRNRIRRRIYEWIRLHQSAISQPYDIVITVYSETVASMDAGALGGMLQEQFERAGLFAESETSGQPNNSGAVQRATGAEHAIVEQIAPPEPKEK